MAANKKNKFKKFEIPQSFLYTLYELTGGAEKNKGFFICYIDESGDVQFRQEFDGQATEFAIMKGLEVFVADNSLEYHTGGSDMDDFEEEDDD
jgi:hypothetical protein